MNYTEVKRYLVYKDKLDIDEFNISDPKSMDGVLFNFLEHSWIAGLADAPKLICSIFDTAHYIVTLIHLEAHPLLHIASYLDKADHVGADGPHFVHTHHLELRAATMGLVCNYLRVLSPEHLDVKAFLRAVHDQIEGLEPSIGARLSVHMVGAFKEPYDIFYEITHLPDIQSRTLLREDFRPRPIEEALKESNYEDIYDNIEYITERINELSKGRQKRAVNILINTTQMTGEDALQGAMPEAAKHVRETMQDIFYAFGYKHVPQEQIGSPDKQKWKKDKAKEDTADANKGSLIEDQAAEIARMKANIERLQLDLEGKQKVDKNMPAHQAAILITALCRELKQMPNNREDLAPVLQYMWGFTKSTAEKALRRAFTPEEAKEVATHFNSITPKIARLIRELPQQLKEENEERLRELNKKNKKS